MKKILLLAVAAFIAHFASAEKVDWYFTTAANNWATNETTQFETTNESGVFVLKGYSNPEATGFQYKITNQAWTSTYGWEESVEALNKSFKLGKDSEGNGWCALGTGTYDIYFTPDASTIEFRDANAGEAAVVALPVEEDASAEYYDLHGIKADFSNMAPGLYIKRQGNKATKILVK